MRYDTIFIKTINGYGPDAPQMTGPITVQIYKCDDLATVEELKRRICGRNTYWFKFRMRYLWKSVYIFGTIT